MFAKAKYPSAGRSCNLLARFSWTMHLEIKEELLFAILFFGFRRFPVSLLVAERKVFPSPKAGAEPIESVALALPVAEVSPPSLLGGNWSPDALPSPGCSCMLELRFDLVLWFVPTLYKKGGELLELNDRRDSLVPAVAGCGVVARGFGFTTGASEGWGGGVARCKSSFKVYVPAITFSSCVLVPNAPRGTFTNNQLVFWSCRV